MSSGKRKRAGEIFFDPNASDPEDEDFDPSENRPARSSKKARPSRGTRPSGRPRRRNRYGGSDIEDDDDDLMPDSDGSFIDESDDEDAPVNAAGRKARKVTTSSHNYRESSDDEEAEFDDDDDDDGLEKEEPLDEIAEAELDDEDEDVKRNTRKVVKLKVSGSALSQMPRRSTRATTEEQDELVELSNSGRHAVPSRDSRSHSPDPVQRRSSRGMKTVQGAPETIDEATQESSIRKSADEDLDELSPDFKNEAKIEADTTGEGGDDDDAAMKLAAELEDDDDDDDVQIGGRRGRPSRSNAAGDAEAEAEAAAESDAAPSNRRLTRKSKRATHEPSSDWEPEDDVEDAGSASENMEDENEAASPTPTGRSRARSARSGTRSGRHDSGDEEEDIDMEELHEEAHELRKSSRRPRRRTESPGIVHERRQRTRVNYFMPPLTAANVEEDEMALEAAATPARRRRGAAAAGWDRSLNNTFGPFGGGGGFGSLLNGPWGSGAAGGADSDSSDDEMVHRSSIAGNPGMTPTSAAAPGGLLPGAMGMNAEGFGGTPNVGKIKDRKALADADPLGVDMNVDFSNVGGLQGHIDQLKEMVQLPLLYPELFTRFHVTPPRGVLFHGPPGTGKTLLARALANSVGSGGRKISFYMRKGADALSKWVGEAEKQLRLLFEEARKTQPSIIFFDEIDGLAPVRSSKQEQIHASIVSTLLALMDGMDGRGQVIVIGATNRPDNIDPALRRPGRFDREFYFPLPDIEGRRSILDIHTKDWGLNDSFKKALAEQTKGYGGADLRALCTEAALNSIQRTYPQIYSCKEKLIVDPSKINVHASDFMISIKKLVPSSERSTTSVARPLPSAIRPLLETQLEAIKKGLDALLPRKKKITALEEAMYEQYDDNDHGFGREALAQEFERSRIFRPRYLICGAEGMGHGYVASAILHYLEGVHVQNFDLPSLLADGRPMEQVIVGLFTEVKRHKPSIIFIPNIDEWYFTLKDSVAFVTFKSMLRAIAPTDPVLLLATAESKRDDLKSTIIQEFFGFSSKNNVEIASPASDDRRTFFTATLNNIKLDRDKFPDPEGRKKRVLEELPVAPVAAPKPPSKAEVKAQKKRDHQILNALKIQLQPIMDQINRKYKKFRQPVIPQHQIDYLFQESDPNFVRPDLPQEGQERPFEIVKDKHDNDVLRDTATGKTYYNLETTTIEERLSNGFYCRPRDFLFDIKALAKDAKNFGDKERTLKANELLSNVEVDVASIEANTGSIDWDALYQRQIKRAKDATEKERKHKAMQSILSRVQSDVGGDSDSQGPVTLGVEVPKEGLATTRFEVKSPLSTAPGGGETQVHSSLSNGDAHETKVEEDVQMSGVENDTQATSPVTTMPPPPRQSEQNSEGLAAATQISQKSAVTSLPPGVSPSAVINDASTTKTSDPSSNRSSNFGTQHTNGDAASLPDTLPTADANNISQSGSSRSWYHSQAQAMAHGSLQPNTLHSSPSAVGSSPATKLTPNQSDDHVHNSGGGSQPKPDITADVNNLIDKVVWGTSGCTVEQLEQVNRELMDAIWHNRGIWSKTLLCTTIADVINNTISDIEAMQNLGELSQ